MSRQLLQRLLIMFKGWEMVRNVTAVFNGQKCIISPVSCLSHAQTWCSAVFYHYLLHFSFHFELNSKVHQNSTLQGNCTSTTNWGSGSTAVHDKKWHRVLELCIPIKGCLSPFSAVLTLNLSVATAWHFWPFCWVFSWHFEWGPEITKIAAKYF